MKKIVLLAATALLVLTGCGVGFDKVPEPAPDHGAEFVGPPTDGQPYIKFRVAILPETPTIDQPYASRDIEGLCHSARTDGQPFTMRDTKTGAEMPFTWVKKGVTAPYEAWYGYISYPPSLFPALQCVFNAWLQVGDSMELEMSWPSGDRCPLSPGDETWVDPRQPGQGSNLKVHPFRVHQLVQGI